jgi:hypothetical protein
MTAGKLNFVIEQGATFRRDIIWKDEAGTPINLTGYTARMQIREHLSSATPLAELTTANGKITLTAASGKLTLLLTATETNALRAGTALYDLELVDAAGNVTRLLQGQIMIEAGVTR